MNNKIRLSPLLRVDTVAMRLEVSIKTVRREIQRGALHSIKVGGQRRISEEDLAAYLAFGRR